MSSLRPELESFTDRADALLRQVDEALRDPSIELSAGLDRAAGLLNELAQQAGATGAEEAELMSSLIASAAQGVVRRGLASDDALLALREGLESLGSLVVELSRGGMPEIDDALIGRLDLLAAQSDAINDELIVEPILQADGVADGGSIVDAETEIEAEAITEADEEVPSLSTVIDPICEPAPEPAESFVDPAELEPLLQATIEPTAALTSESVIVSVTEEATEDAPAPEAALESLAEGSATDAPATGALTIDVRAEMAPLVDAPPIAVELIQASAEAFPSAPSDSEGSGVTSDPWTEWPELDGPIDAQADSVAPATIEPADLKDEPTATVAPDAPDAPVQAANEILAEPVAGAATPVDSVHELPAALHESATVTALSRALQTIKDLAVEMHGPSADAAGDAIVEPAASELREPTAEIAEPIAALEPTQAIAAPSAGTPVEPAMIAPASVAPIEQVPQLPERVASDPMQPQVLDIGAMTGEIGGPQSLTAEDMAAMMGATPGEDDWGTTPLALTPDKAELLTFMVNDLKDAAAAIDPVANEAASMTSRSDAAENLSRLAETIAKTSGYFDFRSLKKLVALLQEIAMRMCDVSESHVPELLMRVRAIASLIGQHAVGLEVGMETNWPLKTLEDRIERIMSGEPVDPAFTAWHRWDVERVLELDKVVEGVEPLPEPGSAPAGSVAAPPPPPPPPPPQLDAAKADGSVESSGPVIRVDASTIDKILEMIGQLVQTKNRLLSQGAGLRGLGLAAERAEALTSTIDEVDRLTGQLQLAIMHTRQQPLSKLFERYPRVIRDIANLSDKKIELKIIGADTRVEKTVFEALGEPLTVLLRFAASKSLETPAERLAANKPEVGQITLSAESQGNQVLITLSDDGQGLDGERIAAEAVQAGMIDAESVDRLSADEILALVCQEGYPGGSLSGLASQVAEKLGGTLRVRGNKGRGITFQMSVPLKSAIIPAVMVGVGSAIYAIPLQSVTEIVRPDEQMLSSVRGQLCLRLREQVIGVVDMHALLGEAREAHAETGGPHRESRCAVMVTVGDERGALMVDRIIGKQEIVIKPLDVGQTNAGQAAGPISGATIRDDGRVSLILDVKRVLESA